MKTGSPTETKSESAELRLGGAARHHRDLEDRDVGPLLGGDDARGHRLLAEELHRDVLHRLDHMRRGRHPPIGRDQDARADLRERDRAEVAHLLPPSPDHDHRRADADVRLAERLALPDLLACGRDGGRGEQDGAAASTDFIDTVRNTRPTPCLGQCPRRMGVQCPKIRDEMPARTGRRVPPRPAGAGAAGVAGRRACEGRDDASRRWRTGRGPSPRSTTCSTTRR